MRHLLMPQTKEQAEEFLRLAEIEAARFGVYHARPQDVEEFISESTDMVLVERDGGDDPTYVIYPDDLRAWMTGHVRVPVELSEKMRDAYWDVHNRNLEGFPGDPAEQAWEAMLNASKGK